MINVVLLLLFSLAVICKWEKLPAVNIKQGKLRGKFLQTQNGRTFSSFTSIPYAKAPVGELRFKPPVPADPWRGVLDASKTPNVCPQSRRIIGDSTISGNEDCLYLNVYTPSFVDSSAANEILPVMIYLHGGFFTWGSGKSDAFGPDILLDRDVVLVVPNYRLGALGFLSTGDKVLPGNNGLKDQSLVIQWVKDNIISFGGDPNKITIFGQSAGGASAHLHMLSPSSKGNIHRVIAQSGTAFSVWAIASRAKAKSSTQKLAHLLNCSATSSFDIVECLRTVDAYSIIAQEKQFTKWNWDPFPTFTPVIEPNNEGAFLTESPLDIYRSGKAAKIPFMTGLTKEDGACKSAGIFVNSSLIKELNNNFGRIAPEALLYADNAQEDYVSNLIRSFYFGSAEISESSRSEVTMMYTDAIFLLAETAAVHTHFKYVKSHPVYFYLFGYRASVSFCSIFGDTSNDYGVCHYDDLLHVLRIGAISPYKLVKTDKKVSEVMLNLWTNFAKTGNPTPVGSKLAFAKWAPVHSENLEYYYIQDDKHLNMFDKPFSKRINFWKTLPIDDKY